MVSDKWKRLTAKSKEVFLTPDVKITVFGLSYKELGDLAEFYDRKDNSGAAKYVLKSALGKAPEIDNEDDRRFLLDNIGAEYATEIIKSIFELSNINTGDVSKKEDGEQTTNNN